MLGVTLSLTDTVVAWISVVLATVSVLVNCSAFHHGVPGLRIVHLAIGLLSMFYVIGYVWLLTFVHDVETWSSAMRGLSLIAWLIVWVFPALTSVRLWRSMRSAVMSEVAEVCER